VPKVCFDLGSAFFTVLSKLAEKRSLSPHQLAKEIIVEYITNLLAPEVYGVRSTSVSRPQEHASQLNSANLSKLF
jgi:hypothetical protein